MRKAGEVQYTNMQDDGTGIVEFSNLEGMEKANEMFQNYDYDGSTLTLKPFQTDESNGDRHRNEDDDQEVARRDKDIELKEDGPASRTRSRSPTRRHEEEPDPSTPQDRDSDRE